MTSRLNSPGILKYFIDSQIGAFGLKTRTKVYTEKDNAAFLDALRPGAIILQGPVKTNYVSGGIQGATDSFWTHTLIYAGHQGGKMIREDFPELMTRKHYPIPKTVDRHEIVEAIFPRCRIGSMTEYLNENLKYNDRVQQIAFILLDLTVEQLIKTLYYAYSRNGTKYDVSEIAHDAFPALQITNHPWHHGCSSLGATSFAVGGRSVIPADVSPVEAWPKDFWTKLYPEKNVRIAKYNW